MRRRFASRVRRSVRVSIWRGARWSLLLSLCLAGSAEAGTIDMDTSYIYESPKGSGLYHVTFRRMGDEAYIIDQVTHLCFFSIERRADYGRSAYASGGLAQVPCRALLRRKELRPLLSWLNESEEE